MSPSASLTRRERRRPDCDSRDRPNPATATFLREAAATAAQRSATLRPGASVQIFPTTLNVRGNLDVDDRTRDRRSRSNRRRRLSHRQRDDARRDRKHRVAEHPALAAAGQRLSRKLGANGVLFSADLDRSAAQRFLYYHYNPGNQPSRRILLRATNPSSQPATCSSSRVRPVRKPMKWKSVISPPNAFSYANCKTKAPS